MGFFSWMFRCVPALSLILWVFICYLAFRPRIASPWGGPVSATYDWRTLTSWEWIYILYSVGAHVAACILFQCRLIWSIWNMTDEVRLAKYEAAEVTRPYTASEGSSSLDDKTSVRSVDDKASLISVNSSQSIPSDAPLTRVPTPKVESFEDLADSVTHAIILPSYKEDYDTLRETVSVLASHVLARTSYDLYLAMEQRDPDAKTTSEMLIQAFGSSFRSISYTLHPGDISGEVAGKSSNVSWAARQLSHNYVDTQSRADCVITVMDSDTHLSSNYFLLLTKHHREDPERGNTLYCVPIIFDRNAQIVNPLVRAADIFWCGAGLSGLYKGSSVMIPTSVYSIAMTLAGQVGGWDTGPESIGEDMHMFLKCYFQTRGQVNTKIIFSPASQSNVSSDTKGLRGALDNIRGRYKQALRHMWGSLDSGYAVQKGFDSLWSKNDEKLSEWLTSPAPEERVPRWVNDSNLTHFTPPNLYEDPPRTRRAGFSWINNLLLYHRMYEAHFLPAHLTVALISAVIYGAFVAPNATHPLLLWSFGFCGTLRFIGFCATAFFVYLYETYHNICVRMREDEMRRVGLYDNMGADGFAYRSWKQNWSDYVVLPINGTLYGSVPAVVAQFSHLFTVHLTYTVSAKPQLKKMAEKIAALA